MNLDFPEEALVGKKLDDEGGCEDCGNNYYEMLEPSPYWPRGIHVRCLECWSEATTINRDLLEPMTSAAEEFLAMARGEK